MTEYSVSVRFKKNKIPCLHTLMKCAAHVCADISSLVVGPNFRYCCTFTEIFLSHFEMTHPSCVVLLHIYFIQKRRRQHTITPINGIVGMKY
jgi:hypothetical protein